MRTGNEAGQQRVLASMHPAIDKITFTGASCVGGGWLRAGSVHWGRRGSGDVAGSTLHLACMVFKGRCTVGLTSTAVVVQR